MSNKKGFSAHEKHFNEKSIKFNREINYLRRIYQETNDENVVLRMENKKLKEDNVILKKRCEKLLSYTNLTDEELKAAVQKDGSVNKLAALIDVMSYLT